MTDVPSRHATYPFFDASEESLVAFDRDDMSEPVVQDRAIDRIVAAAECDPDTNPTIGDSEEENWVELLSYPLARILVSIIDNDDLTEKYARAESNAAAERIDIDNDLSIYDGCAEFGLDVTERDWETLFRSSAIFEDWDDLSLATRARRVNGFLHHIGDADHDNDFFESSMDVTVDELLTRGHSFNYTLSSKNRKPSYAVAVDTYLIHSPAGDNWTLANRSVHEGGVLVHNTELKTLLERAIHARISENLPVDVPAELVYRYDDAIARLVSQLPVEFTATVDAASFPLLNADSLARPYAIDQENREKYAALGADEVELDITDIRDHYHKASEVYEELGSLNGYHTSWLGAAQHAGWYVTDDIENKEHAPSPWNDGFKRFSRPSILPDDFDASKAGRAVYTTNTYAPRDAFTERYYTVDDGERVWWDDQFDDAERTRLPDYDELAAYALIVDIDLEDEWKNRPLPDEYQDIVEHRLDAWVGAFASFVGGDRDDVFAVDSGGGAYVMTPPAATIPIAERFDGEDLHLINNAIQTRMRTLTDALDTVITGLDDAPDELFSADAVQNKNRQWKSLLSLHASLDAVVHPIDPNDVDYDALWFDDLDDTHYADAKEWAERFTSREYDDESYVAALVNALFQSDIYDHIGSPYDTYDGDTWTDVLENFVEDRQQENEKRRKAFENIETGDGSINEVGVTTNKYEIDAALANIDLEKHLRDGHVQQWDTDNRSDGTVSFSPKSWRNPSPDANSCFYGPGTGADDAPVFVDRKEGWTAGIVDLAAYDAGITSHPSETPRGADWWKAIAVLRENYDEDIPVHLPDIDDPENDFDHLGEEYIVEAALALGIADEGDVKTVDGEYGPYQTLTDKRLYAQTLEKLEDLDIKHGRS